MSGATIPVRSSGGARVVLLRTVAPDEGLPGDTLLRAAWEADARRGDAYAIVVRRDSLLLLGRSGRAVLYAAYDLLGRLGCVFVAPELAFYEGAAESVPKRATLTYTGGSLVERPAFAIRKLDVEEGLSHDTESLRRIIAWMPKARYNTLQVPMDYNGAGRVRWDAWRAALTPELKRRGLLIEVGGHGYQNFLAANMDSAADGTVLFDRRPDWFGRDASCRPARAERLVFNTANADAVAYLTERVVRYVREHPEIDVLDFWPPDGARWAECPEWAALGTPQDRQARLLNAVREAVAKERPGLRLEIIAYANAKLPPETVTLHPDVLVDFCPIGQNFDVGIDDSSGANNALYVAAIRAWRRAFAGDIGLYSYYRKYAWLSLPVVIPRYIARDLRWYASVPLQGISTYAEPGDWYTYELNHWALGQLAWHPDANADSLVTRYARARYGGDAPRAIAAIGALEDVVRVYGSVPYSRPRPAADIAAARDRIRQHMVMLEPRTNPHARPPAPIEANLDRMILMLLYAYQDLGIMHARAAGADSAAVSARVDSLTKFLTINADRGVFLLTGRNDRARIARHYAPRPVSAQEQ